MSIMSLKSVDELKVSCAISLICVPVGPHGSLLVAVGWLVTTDQTVKITLRMTSQPTFANLHLGTGVALGDIFHASHNL